MTRKLFAIAILIVAALLLGRARPAIADDEKEADMKKLEAIVDNVLKAYNDEDYKKFYADYTKLLKDSLTEQFFKAVVVDGYKKKYGKYLDKTKKLYKPKSATKGDMPTLLYLAEFEKDKKAVVAFNFTTEDGAYKILQVQIMPFMAD